MTALVQELGGGAFWLLGIVACTCIVVGIFILVESFLGQ
jgi:hypothetical protein